MKFLTFSINGVVTRTNVTLSLPSRFVAPVEQVGDVTFIQVASGQEADIVLDVSEDCYRLTTYQQPIMADFGCHVTISRRTKALYNRVLNKLFKDQEGYHPLTAYDSTRRLPDDVGTWVFRPVLGARGMAIGIVPKGRTPEWLRTKLKEHENAESMEVFKKIGIDFALDTHGATPEACFETTRGLLNALEFVPFVSDVEHEARLITDHKGVFSLCVVRDRIEKTGSMTMASTVDVPIHNCHNTSSLPGSVPKKLQKIIQRLPAVPSMPLHSFDLFVRKDGTWGFFEACCEYGESCVQVGWTHKQTKLYMAYLADFYYRNQT